MRTSSPSCARARLHEHTGNELGSTARQATRRVSGSSDIPSGRQFAGPLWMGPDVTSVVLSNAPHFAVRRRQAESAAIECEVLRPSVSTQLELSAAAIYIVAYELIARWSIFAYVDPLAWPFSISDHLSGLRRARIEGVTGPRVCHGALSGRRPG